MRIQLRVREFARAYPNTLFGEELARLLL
ncbi:hypothetical protein A2U01_0108635 [Trifolium medium]|uniref:Uncharacterized protein n=1 Tax=Trifolium medium TaxID=97028 RepID=A0A392VIV3_9FABA|nr:hypothetical protein [Trifolium medium]